MKNKRTKKAQTNRLETVADEGLFVTAAEVATALRYTPKAVRQMIERGDLPGRKFGGEWRMHKDDFAKLTKPQLQDEAA